jgi:nucleotide-binding universal stress UspA family protein
VAALPQYRKILLATDGSTSAALAACHALALAHQTGATLGALYVVDTHLAFTEGIYQHEAIRELKQDGQRALATIAAQAREAGVEAATHLVEGRPGETIISTSESLSADLIVVGSHGQGAVADILLGSVSQHVIHHAQVPVCVVRPPRR